MVSTVDKRQLATERPDDCRYTGGGQEARRRVLCSWFVFLAATLSFFRTVRLQPLTDGRGIWAWGGVVVGGAGLLWLVVRPGAFLRVLRVLLPVLLLVGVVVNLAMIPSLQIRNRAHGHQISVNVKDDMFTLLRREGSGALFYMRYIYIALRPHLEGKRVICGEPGLFEEQRVTGVARAREFTLCRYNDILSENQASSLLARTNVSHTVKEGCMEFVVVLDWPASYRANDTLAVYRRGSCRFIAPPAMINREIR